MEPGGGNGDGTKADSRKVDRVQRMLGWNFVLISSSNEYRIPYGSSPHCLLVSLLILRHHS